MGLFRRPAEVYVSGICCDVGDCDCELLLRPKEELSGFSILDTAANEGWTFDGPLAACPECSKKKDKAK